MTTEEAAARYLNEHRVENAGKPPVIHNPHNKEPDDLPRIYCFSNGTSSFGVHAVAIAADGAVLGGHACSHEGYIEHDLGVIEGTRADRHEGQYRPHYPDGYVMEFVPSHDRMDHEGLNKAIKANLENRR